MARQSAAQTSVSTSAMTLALRRAGLMIPTTRFAEVGSGSPSDGVVPVSAGSS